MSVDSRLKVFMDEGEPVAPLCRNSYGQNSVAPEKNGPSQAKLYSSYPALVMGSPNWTKPSTVDAELGMAFKFEPNGRAESEKVLRTDAASGGASAQCPWSRGRREGGRSTLDDWTSSASRRGRD